MFHDALRRGQSKFGDPEISVFCRGRDALQINKASAAHIGKVRHDKKCKVRIGKDRIISRVRANYRIANYRIKTGTEQLWTHKIKITAVKNKLAQPFFRGELIIDYGKGINLYASATSLAEAEGVVPVSGNGMVD